MHAQNVIPNNCEQCVTQVLVYVVGTISNIQWSASTPLVPIYSIQVPVEWLLVHFYDYVVSNSVQFLWFTLFPVYLSCTLFSIGWKNSDALTLIRSPSHNTAWARRLWGKEGCIIICYDKFHPRRKGYGGMHKFQKLMQGTLHINFLPHLLELCSPDISRYISRCGRTLRGTCSSMPFTIGV